MVHYADPSEVNVRIVTKDGKVVSVEKGQKVTKYARTVAASQRYLPPEKQTFPERAPQKEVTVSKPFIQTESGERVTVPQAVAEVRARGGSHREAAERIARQREQQLMQQRAQASAIQRSRQEQVVQEKEKKYYYPRETFVEKKSELPLTEADIKRKQVQQVERLPPLEKSVMFAESVLVSAARDIKAGKSPFDVKAKPKFDVTKPGFAEEFIVGTRPEGTFEESAAALVPLTPPGFALLAAESVKAAADVVRLSFPIDEPSAVKRFQKFGGEIGTATREFETEFKERPIPTLVGTGASLAAFAILGKVGGKVVGKVSRPSLKRTAIRQAEFADVSLLEKVSRDGETGALGQVKAISAVEVKGEIGRAVSVGEFDVTIFKKPAKFVPKQARAFKRAGAFDPRFEGEVSVRGVTIQEGAPKQIAPTKFEGGRVVLGEPLPFEPQTFAGRAKVAGVAIEKAVGEPIKTKTSLFEPFRIRLGEAKPSPVIRLLRETPGGTFPTGKVTQAGAFRDVFIGKGFTGAGQEAFVAGVAKEVLFIPGKQPLRVFATRSIGMESTAAAIRAFGKPPKGIPRKIVGRELTVVRDLTKTDFGGIGKPTVEFRGARPPPPQKFKFKDVQTRQVQVSGELTQTVIERKVSSVAGVAGEFAKAQAREAATSAAVFKASKKFEKIATGTLVIPKTVRQPPQVKELPVSARGAMPAVSRLFRPSAKAVQVERFERVPQPITTSLGFVRGVEDVSIQRVGEVSTGLKADLIRVKAAERLPDILKTFAQLPVEEVLQRTEQVQRVGRVQRTSQLLRQRTILRQAQRPGLFKVSLPKPVVSKIPKPFIPLPPISFRGAKAPKLVEAFQAVVRKKGKLVTLGGALPYGKAFALAKKEVFETSARSFGIIRIGKKIKAPKKKTAVSLFGLRKPKGKTKLPKGFFVEVSKLAIKEPKELRDITYKGLAALRSSRRKPMLSLSLKSMRKVKG